jgi:threonine dehydrogenase-like Zn-dependent dehydrogenase
VSGGDVPLSALAERIGEVDVIFEAVGVSSVAFAALDVLGPNGVYVMTGIPAPGAPKEVDADRIMRDLVLKNQRVVGIVNAGRGAYEEAVRELEQAMFLFPESVRALITQRWSIDEARERIHERAGIKQVVCLGKQLAA